ncbi:MAG: type II toxin-antitoxin system Phd/YefM family antitoxin [Candidatus Omnitrophica bacterium]|nr:type II toxin-antitoxin system Phd/YefM family antitoxin [Candidatus Omnitrophota bacterium]
MKNAFLEKPQFVIKEGKPTAVILGIKTFEELLERIEDVEDLAELKRIKKGSLKFRKFEDFLAEANV